MDYAESCGDWAGKRTCFSSFSLSRKEIERLRESRDWGKRLVGTQAEARK
jgi:hypothetical protein